MEEAHPAYSQEELPREGQLIAHIAEAPPVAAIRSTEHVAGERILGFRLTAKGEPPVVQFCFTWDHVSLIASMHLPGIPFFFGEGSF